MISSTSLVEGKKNSSAEENLDWPPKAAVHKPLKGKWPGGRKRDRIFNFLLVITVITITFVLLSNRNPNPCHVAAQLIGVSTSRNCKNLFQGRLILCAVAGYRNNTVDIH